MAAAPNSESVAFSKDGKWLAAAVGARDRPGKVMLWKLQEPNTPALVLEHPLAVRALAFHPSGKLLATGCEDQQVRLFDLESDTPAAVILKPEGSKKAHTRAVTAVTFSPDGQWLASAGNEETIFLWNVLERALDKELIGKDDDVTSLAFSPDSALLASGSVRLWSVASGNHVVLGHNKGWTRAVAFSPDGKLVASGSDDKVVRLWDVQARAEHRNLEGSASHVLTVAFHPDGKRLVSAGEDKVVRLWDLVTGQKVLELEGSTGAIKCVTFSRDGRWLAAVGFHNAIRLWEAPR